MEIQEINNFIEWEEKRLEEFYNNKSRDEITMAMGFKVIEEIGELFDEMLAHKGYQRKEKLDKLNKEEIKKEFGDVVITIFFLAKRFDIDMEKAIKIKMGEIKNRKYE